MFSWLIRTVLSQRLMVVIVTAIFAGWGYKSYKDLSIDAFPDISVPQVQVICKAPSMGPLEVEQRITRPIEVVLQGIPYVTMLRSVTKYALSVITIDFQEDLDIYWARQQVNERIAQVLKDLPESVDAGLAPITMPLSDVYMFIVDGPDYTATELRNILDWIIRPRLLTAPGVADVNALGGHVQTFEIQPVPSSLVSYGLNVQDIITAVQENNQNAGGDRFQRNNEVILIRTIGQIKTLEDMQDIPLTQKAGVVIRLKDVAEVKYGSLTRYGAVVRNGKGEGVQGLILNRRGADSRKTIEGAKEILAKLQETLPKGVTIKPFYDRSDLIEKAVATVETALFQAVVLVIIVLLLFLGNWRSAFSAGIILPLTVIGTFIPMHLFGLTANLMSLGGIAIAIGILVDSAVVMVENIHRQLGESGSSARKLNIVYRAAVEVAIPIVAGVIIIITSFMPILSLEGLEGRLFKPLAFTIVFALITSLILSLTIIPVMASYLLKKSTHGQSRFLSLLQDKYQQLLVMTMQHRKSFVSIALVLMLATITSLAFIGKEFLPFLDEGTMVVQVEKIPSISLEQSIKDELKIQKALLALPEIDGIYSRIGSDELRLDPMGLNETDSFIQFSPEDTWTVDSIHGIQEKMRDVLSSFPGIRFGFTQPIDMRVSETISGVRSAVAIKLRGMDLPVLEQKAKEIERVLRTVTGSVDIMRAPLSGQKYLTIKMNHQIMGQMGISTTQINSLIQSAIGGSIISDVIQGNRRIPIQIRFKSEDRSSAKVIKNLMVTSATGEKVPLSTLTTIEEVNGPVQLSREGGQRQVVIQVNVVNRDIVGFVDEVDQLLKQKVSLPSGYYYEFGGQFENQQRAAKRLITIVPIVIFAVFLLLFFTFQSTRQAGLILLNVPFALMGGVIALAISGLYLSVPASVGFIALFGLAIMNGVVMVNYFNQLRSEGLQLPDAVMQGSMKRLRPVLMTAILTVLGLVPLLLATGPGSEIQKPLAVVVVGGTVSSTLLTLLMLPLLYQWIEEIIQQRASKKVRDIP